MLLQSKVPHWTTTSKKVTKIWCSTTESTKHFQTSLIILVMSMLMNWWQLLNLLHSQEKVFLPPTNQQELSETDSKASELKTLMRIELLIDHSYSMLQKSKTISQELFFMTRPLEIQMSQAKSSSNSLPKRTSSQESRSILEWLPSKELMMRLPLWVLTVWTKELENTMLWESDSQNGELSSRSMRRPDVHLNKPLMRQPTLLLDTDPSANTLDLSQSLSQKSSPMEAIASKNVLKFLSESTMLCNLPSSATISSKRDSSGSQTWSPKELNAKMKHHQKRLLSIPLELYLELSHHPSQESLSFPEDNQKKLPLKILMPLTN